MTDDLGPLILVAVLYEVLGVVMAWITKTFFWVPHRFRYGIILAGGWGNVGDIPTSVIMSLTAAAPFASDGSDQALSVAYISPFILVYMMTLFPMGAHHLIAKDFVGPDVENDEIKEQVRERRKLLLYRWPRALLRFRGSGTESDLEIQPHGLTEKEQRLPSSIRPRAHKHVSFLGEPSNTNHQNYEDHDLDVTSTAVPTDGAITPAQSCFTSPDDTIAMDDLEGVNTPKALELESKTTIPTTRQQRRKRVLLKVRALIKSILTPASISMLAAIPIALIPQLKGLFTPTSNANIPNAPDGQPPLAFILDFANFMGAASVPMGLTCLGSALARLNVPWGEWSQLPVGAIFCLAILKMVVSPVVGVLITIGLTKAGLISEEDKVLQFVCMFFSCLPTATTQVYLTQVYSGTGTAEFFSPFLLPQYFIMFFSMTGLTAYSITYLF
ncbi:hypothetical protein D9757_005832 [Collybiopsis confluens]|uniref:Auxin efflux carrier n=1 Tax=Collybiopsis confluens TaxID=2823264 RepID=A0A8H5HND7_9AGAR|nr:hypothetical protein D9757_005832 [Collybiopsis confluens]